MELSLASGQSPTALDSPGTHTPWFQDHDGVLHLLDSLYRHRVSPKRSRGGSNLDAHHDRISIVDAHAVGFSKTAKPHRKGFLLEETDPTQRPGAPAGRPGSIARCSPPCPLAFERATAGRFASRSLLHAQTAE